MAIPSRADCQSWDTEDTLRPLREQFALPDDVIYLDGNSLGVLPRAAPELIADAVARQWGGDLITSWNKHGWIDLPQRLGAMIAPLIGANGAEVVVADSTSINLFKLLAAALRHQRLQSPQRATIVSERSNFPTDLYVMQGLSSCLAALANSGCVTELD